MKSADLQAVKEVSEVWLPLLSEGQEDSVNAFLAIFDGAWNGKITPPAIAYGDEIHDTEIKPDGTYLVVFETVIPDKEPTVWLDMKMESVLPHERIPSTVEEADYIIRCHTEYNKSTKSGGAILHFPDTRITLHDAHDGTLLRDLGSVNRRLSGVVMLPKGDTWWEPLRTKVWEKIKILFAED